MNDVFDPEFTVLLFEFKHDVNAYLKGLTKSGVRSLKDLIAYDDAHADTEMPWFAQEIFEIAQATDGLDDPAYLAGAPATPAPVMRAAIDDTLAANDLDAIVSLTGGPPWTTDLVNGDHFLTAQLDAGGRRRVPEHQRPGRLLVRRAPRRDLVHRHQVERADADQAGVRVRGEHGAPARSDVPPVARRAGLRATGRAGPAGFGGERLGGARNARPDTPGARMAGRL